MAHIEARKATSFIAVRPVPRLTVVGLDISESDVPDPHCPLLLSPQHFVEPSDTMTHTLLAPSTSCVTDPPTLTNNGVLELELVVEPPSCEYSLLPQQ